MKILRSICMAFFAIGIGIGGLTWAQEGPKEAISFVLNDVNGTPVSMDDYFGKQPVLLSFFATWCPACNEEVPQLQAINKDHGKEISIFAIDIKEAPAKVSSFIKKKNIAYRVLLDVDGKVAEEYQVRGIPTIVLIDTERKILYYGHDLAEAKKRFPDFTKAKPPRMLGTKGVERYVVQVSELGKEAFCPVMGEKFKLAKGNPAAKYKGAIYYFCCSSCIKKFIRDPERYIKK